MTASIIRLAPFLPPREAWRLLAASLAFALAACIFAHWGLAAQDRTLGEAAERVAARVDADAPLLRRWLRSGQRLPGGEIARPPSPQVFLHEVEAAAFRSGVQVTRFTPKPNEPGALPGALNIEFVSSFGQMLRFVAEGEALGGVLRGLQVQPADGPGPVHAQLVHAQLVRASLSLQPGGPALRPASQAAAIARLATVADQPGPFAPLGPGEQDLSARFHLTAITRIGADRMATIDGRDYLVGDQLAGMEVSAITDSAVTLTAEGRRAALRFPRAALTPQ